MPQMPMLVRQVRRSQSVTVPGAHNNGIRRSLSLPGFHHIYALLNQGLALLVQFQTQYTRVWNNYIPNVTIRLADAETLVPKMRFLLKEPILTTSKLRSVYDILVMLKKNIAFTIDPDKIQQATSDHGQVCDLLDRAINSIRNAIALLDVRLENDMSLPVVQDLTLMSSNEIMAASIILKTFLEKALGDPAYSILPVVSSV